MEIKVTCENRRAEVFLKGELDHHGAKGLMVQIEREIERQLPLQLILDFTGRYWPHSGNRMKEEYI